MGVALARGRDVERAKQRAVAAAAKVKIEYRDGVVA
jgi:formate-dependent phosphoribosylglycinamide formyltransferase (GAR transformylase)